MTVLLTQDGKSESASVMDHCYSKRYIRFQLAIVMRMSHDVLQSLDSCEVIPHDNGCSPSGGAGPTFQPI